MLRKLREPINGLTHLGAAVVALGGLGLLVYLGRRSASQLAPLTIYGLALVTMFAASATYHLVRARPEVIQVLRKIDHAAIYLLIAGTYTPVSLHFFTGFWRVGFLAIIWSLALIGVGVKLFVIRAPRGVTAGLYLLLGWMSLLAIQQILTRLPLGALIWLAMGGLFFTVGALIYIFKWPNFKPGVFGFHEVWHIFVILGAYSHYVLIAAFVAASLPH